MVPAQDCGNTAPAHPTSFTAIQKLCFGPHPPLTHFGSKSRTGQLIATLEVTIPLVVHASGSHVRRVLQKPEKLGLASSCFLFTETIPDLLFHVCP